MGRLFGTDGIRGLANEVITPELALSLGTALASSLAPGSHVAVGGDTRPSTPYLDHAVTAGLAAGGVHVIRLGVVPTATVAYVVATGAAEAGVVISASHNPAPDNGLKVFGAGGFKLDDATEDTLEVLMSGAHQDRRGSMPGSVESRHELIAAYSAALLATLPHPLAGLRMVVDCANGAASTLAPELYRAAGATVTAIATGDGVINDGVGATHLEALRSAVLEQGADLGIAHDGDADRCLAIAADGGTVDGDQILAILALAGGETSVVTTVMANLGFHHAMRDAGVAVLTTPVGDRYVLEAMRAGGAVVGGEQSGHLVLLNHATTGDGLLTALHLMSRVVSTGEPLAKLAAVVQRLPQVLRGVPAPKSVLSRPEVQDAISAESAALGDDGRVLVRASGTEPLVRVMVEAMTVELAEQVCARLCSAVAAAA